MDDRRFDQLTRALGGASTRRSALAALAAMGMGLLAGGAALDADAKRDQANRRRKRRNRCKPACTAGRTCIDGACVCASGGAACGDACCGAGQVCRDGACADPLPACLPPGHACKDTGRRCCDGRACASGQGGGTDIACYAPAGAACGTTDDCVFGTECRDGSCVLVQPPFPDLPDESCEPNVASGDSQGILRALREEGEARLAPGEYLFELGEGETAIDLPRGGRIIGCRGAGANGRSGREGRTDLLDWSIVCSTKDGAVSTTCVRLVTEPTDWPYNLLYRVWVNGRGSTSATRTIGLFDDDTQLHTTWMVDTLVSCFNMGIVESQRSLSDWFDYRAAFCGNVNGNCYKWINSTLTPNPAMPACAWSVSCSCGGSRPCTPNVAAGDTADLLDQLAAGDAVLPPNSIFAFEITATLQAAIEIPAGLSTKLRACPGTDRSTVNIVCFEAQSQTPIAGWKCIKHQGASLTVENVTITGGNPEDLSTSGIFTAPTGSTLSGPLILNNTKVTGFGIGLYNTGLSTLTCAGNAICGNSYGNCWKPGQAPNDISASCTGCVAGTGTCPA